jgi:predicted transcriptional regulator
MTEAISLNRSERQRLARLAREADCGISEILRDVLRDGFEYTEYKVKAVNEGLADFSAGKAMSLDQLRARLLRRRAERGRTRRKVA